MVTGVWSTTHYYFSSWGQVNNLRIQALRRLSPYPTILCLHKVLYASDENPGSLSLVCEFMSMNIYELMKDKNEGESHCLEKKIENSMYQQADSTSPRWYAPECLLTNGLNSYKIGMWSRCVFYEITRYCVQWRVLLIINQDNQR
ncbi:LOW QUALITY PROTEIN: MAPK/MAK/MRK overlapping kinase [Acridotheres tristis]